MPSQPQAYSDSSVESPRTSSHYDRADAAQGLKEVDALRHQGVSQRSVAKELGIARGTFRHWGSRRERLELPPEIAGFLECPSGLVWLHQLVHAAIFVMTFRGPEGIRRVCEFLHLSGLDVVVASSFGSVQKLTLQMQESIGLFGEEQRRELGGKMATKSITLCEDETFHPLPCLVAIEPASNFILVERYADRRDASTWNHAVERALEGLSVEVFQSTSDEGKALLRHAKDMKAHHSPDLFHPQRDLSKATALPLAARIKRATAGYEEAVRDMENQVAAQTTFYRKPRKRGRPPDFKHRIHRAEEVVLDARQKIEAALADQEAAREAIRGLGLDYHCYRLADGLAQSSFEVESRLAVRFSVIDEIAERVGLSEKCLKRINKARRVTVAMVATIKFVHTEISVRLAGLDLTPELREAVATKAIPGTYLKRVSEQVKTAEKRIEIDIIGESLLSPLRALDHPLQKLEPEHAADVDAVIKTCVEMFQRSSSCVEGRNGHLALFHHGLHRLTDKKLTALTVVHNFHTRRPDGTTPADRFFGFPHPDLFLTLLKRMPQLARPAKPRSLKPYKASMRVAA